MNEKFLLGIAFLSAIIPSWTQCTEDEISCGDDGGVQCYARVSRCDGQIDCDSAHDELQCEDYRCEEGEFQCSIGNCILATEQCNHVADCYDGSDESDCVWECDLNKEFLCAKTGKCIRKEERCDGTLNCGGFDDSDEIDCDGVCDDKQFHCSQSPDGKCISSNWRCDGYQDCTSGEDELNCPGRPSCDDGFLCDSNTKCLDQLQVCDQRQDCVDGSDERARDCMAHCGPTQWACGGHGFGYCIQAEYRCDGHTDCLDQSDERNCGELPPCKDGIRCSDGSCIPAYWRCDGNEDCDGGIDESDCDRCIEGEFMCHNNTCISTELVCDSKNDCPSAVDELHCLYPGEVCGEGMFMCHKTNKCIPLPLYCNEVDDCGDASDEATGCQQWDSCTLNNGGCQHQCITLPHSTNNCSCYHGYQLADDTVSCTDIDECRADILACSQFCTNIDGSFTCSCDEGYKLDVNGKSCYATDFEAYIVFSNVQQMRRTSLDGRQSSLLFDITAPNIMHILDYKLDQGGCHGCVDQGGCHGCGQWYWVSEERLVKEDGYETVVHVRYFNNSGVRRIYSDLATRLSIRDLAVDWITGNLYIVGKVDGEGMLSVIPYSDNSLPNNHNNTNSNHSNTHHSNQTSALLALISEDLLDPFSLVLDPRDGLVFWTDVDDRLPGSVGRADMDGGNRRMLADNVGWANGITLDYTRRKVIWIDAGGVDQDVYPGRVEEMDYNGANRRLVKFLAPDRIKPWSITMFEDSYYWTDSHRTQEAIVKCDRFNTSITERIRTRLQVPMAIKVVHPLRQPAGVDHCHNNSCSHFCALAPAAPSCLCPQGLVLVNRTQCVLPTRDVICPSCDATTTVCVRVSKSGSSPALYNCVYKSVDVEEAPSSGNDTGNGYDAHKLSSISWWICLIIACLVIVVVVVGIVGCKRAASCKPCFTRMGGSSAQDYIQISIQPTQTLTTDIASEQEKYNRKESEI